MAIFVVADNRCYSVSIVTEASRGVKFGLCKEGI
jgi:hypothetical protein